ncbi:HNH endonuclease [Gleimia hominis]|uniref:HNH endonuclease n=1 Tax=Gleimia hominis TaxID=595468 RepID=A0ABU3IE12_9ACTO|nr:HNH endonuclease [Gleimia hominis]MDT3768186.1 HNH endonuclease [Gleimia hominis]
MTLTRNVYVVHVDGTAELRCGNDVVLVDADMVNDLAERQWSVGIHGYATSGAGKNQILMHRLITGAKPGQIVDHINRDRLDNRTENLRICTQQENSYNRSAQANSKSGLKGVCQLSNGTWQAQIMVNRKAYYLGRFPTAREAADAYDRAATTLFGEFAVLNSPKLNDEHPTNSSGKAQRSPRLTDKQQETILSLYREGMSKTALAEMFNRDYTVIQRCINRSRHVEQQGSEQ